MEDKDTLENCDMVTCAFWLPPQRVRWFILGSSIASDILCARFFVNCDILGVKFIRIDPLEPNIWLSFVSYAVLQLFF